jgi:hypothetical protein
LYEVGYNHFFRGGDGDHPADMIFFQGHAPGKKFTGCFRGAHGMDLVRLHYITLIEIHDKLTGQRFHGRALVPEYDARLAGERSGFHERIFHAGNLAHGAQRFQNHGGAHTFGAQITQLFDLQEVKKGIGVRREQ